MQGIVLSFASYVNKKKNKGKEIILDCELALFYTVYSCRHSSEKVLECHCLYEICNFATNGSSYFQLCELLQHRSLSAYLLLKLIIACVYMF